MNKTTVKKPPALPIVPFICLLLPVLASGVIGEMTPETIVNLKSASQARLDPSGRYVAYVLRQPRSEDDEPGGRYSEIWVASLEGGEPRRFTSKPVSAWAPQWTANGREISFLSKRDHYDKSTQIYLIPVDGGEARIVTHHETDIRSYRWSPDGKWIAFTAVDGESEQEATDEEKGKDWTVMHEDEKFTRLWIHDTETGESEPLFRDDLNVWNYRWAPDSRSIFFQASDRAGADPSLMFKKLYTVPVRGGRPRHVCKTEGKLGDMAISPNGKTLAYLGAVSLNDPLPQSLFVVPTEGGDPVNLTEGFQESAFQLFWVDDETVLLATDRGTQTTLSKININTDYRRFLVQSDQIIHAVDFIPENGIFAVSASARSHPAEVFWGSIEGGDLHRLTDHNPELASVDLARQETIVWVGPDELSIEGILTYPLKYRKSRSYPLILLIHGGPEGVSQNGWTTHPLSPVQLLAAEGYAVLQPNYRGSGGRGVEFSKGDHNDLGGKEFHDVLAGVDSLIKLGLVDGDRVGTAGWSYGGYFSAWAATRYSYRFKAAVVGAGLSNWISFAGTTDIPHEMSLVHWDSWWYDVPDLHWERSPLYHINEANTPTLVVHGARDERVHPEQGLELYQALRIKGVPTRLVLYPREPHGLGERTHQLDYMGRLLKWFDDYVK